MANTKVTTNVIADDAVTNAKVAANAIDSDQYVDGSIDTVHISDDAVTSAKLDTNITIAGTLGVSGAFTSLGIDDNANALAITIDSSENVMIGKTSSSGANKGVELRQNGLGLFTGDGTYALQVRRLTDDGNLAEFYTASVGVGVLGTLSGDLYIGNADVTLQFNDSADAITPRGTAGAQRDGAVSLGTGGNRFKDLHMGGNALIGGTLGVTGLISGTTATASGSTSTTALASTAFVQQELTTLIGGAPSTLNDLNELAAAINDDANYNSTLTTALATKLPLAGGTMTGDITMASSAQINASSAFYLDSDIVHFRANNETERMRIQSSGVGIGTAAPAANFQVGLNTDSATTANSLVHLLSSTASSTVNAFSTLKLDYTAGSAPSTAGAQIMFNQGYHSGNPDYTQPVGAIRGWKTGPDTNYGGGLQFLYQPDSGALGVLVGMTMTGAGNVGIGVASPGTRLDILTVANTAGVRVTAPNTTGQSFGTTIAAGTNSSDYAFNVNNAAGAILLKIRGDGNVGIGTTSPDYLLDVSKSTVGGVTDSRVFNEATTNAASGARGIIAVANGDVGDPRLVLGVTGIADYHLGIDNSDSDKLKIGSGSDPSAGTNYLTIDSGNVGIGGSTSLDNKLEVLGNIRLRNAPSSNPSIKLNNGDVEVIGIELESGASGVLGLRSNSLNIDVNGNVGIGENAPANLLHVKASDTGIAPHASAQIVLEREGTNYLQFLTAENGTSGILFGDGSDVDVSKIYVDHNTTKMTFTNETVDTMTLNGANVGIGTASPATLLHINGATADSGKLLIQSETLTNNNRATLFMSSQNVNGHTGNVSIECIHPNNQQSDLVIRTGATDATSFGTEALRVDTSGNVTMPLQPAFNVYPASVQSNIAVNTAVTIVFGTEAFDQGSDFASNTFTAPVTGKYQLNVHLQLNALDIDPTLYQLQIITSNKSYNLTLAPKFASDPAYYGITNSVLADMDASDTVLVKIYQTGGTAQTDVAVDSNFSGFLVC
jgi:hypothetical protein